MDLPAEARTYQYTDSTLLRRHLQLHLRDLAWPIACPHPLCMVDVKGREDFGYHMIDYHGKGIHTKDFYTGFIDNVRGTAPEHARKTAKREIGGRTKKRDGEGHRLWTVYDRVLPCQGVSVYNLETGASLD